MTRDDGLDSRARLNLESDDEPDELFVEESTAYVLPPPIERAGPPIPPADDRAVRTSSSMSWLVGLLAFLLLTTHLVPLAVERIRYAWVRGQQRAEYDVAGEALKKVRFDDLSQAFQLVSQRVGPSVVHISCITETGPPSRNPTMQFRGLPFRHADQGSGVIVDAAGYIMTNRHVVVDAVEIEVKLSDGRQVRAVLIGQDEFTDLAVLKINAPNLIAAEWGDSDRLSVGSLVWALGSPFGLENSITFGILSAKHRAGKIGNAHRNYYQDFLQTDAAVNPGNSGGPLVDVSGRVVGINTAIVGDAYQGVSFAVPSQVAQRIYREILQNGTVARGWLGVRPETVTPAIAKQLGLEKPQGARVSEVVKEYGGRTSPAFRAGLRADDVIIAWGETPVRTDADLFRAVAGTTPGDRVNVSIIREGTELQIEVLVEVRTVE